MGAKAAVGSGLVVGVLAGGLLVGAILLVVPAPAPPPSTPPPSASAPALAAPSRSETPGATSAPSATSAAPSAPAASPADSAARSAAPSPSSADAGFGVGKPAPALKLPKLGGGTIDLAALRGKPVWVNFMATWCPSCIDELPVMAGFAARYRSAGLEVVAVDVREDASSVAAFFKGMGVSMPVGLDSDGSAQSAWRALALPVHFWIDAQGVVRDAALGGVGPDIMAKGLQSILPGVTVTP
jgi:cytochrome c biogenesis protein CcmG/thiol:disulfide interchange protein DsbE